MRFFPSAYIALFENRTELQDIVLTYTVKCVSTSRAGR